MTVTLQNPVVKRGRTVGVVAGIENVGPRSCVYGGTDHPNAAMYIPQTMGPCATMPFAVYRPVHHEIWPRLDGEACPALPTQVLPPHGTLAVTGGWGQQLGLHSGLPAKLPTGRYWVVVDDRFRFTIRMT